jgi:AraC family transcriptional regulator
MLRYFAKGRVRWKNIMRCHTRTNWEFYAVIEGPCGLRFSDQDEPVAHEKTLWIFAPECSHAWANDGANAYHRVSLQFGSVPYPLDEIVRQRGGWLTKKLSQPELDRLQTLATELEPHFCQPTLASPLHFQRALAELALLVLGGQELSSQQPTLTDLSNFKIERALSWYAEHLNRSPSVKQVADAIHISPSHLRRLFWQTRRTSPKAQFRQLRLEKARELMGRTSLTLEEIARHCGYASASHFCREYKAVNHFTPTTWRKRLIDRFVRPLPQDVVHLRTYSVRPQERTMPA